MSNKLLIGTRKGLFVAEKVRSSWLITQAMLLGEPVTMVLADRNQYWHAAVDHGHFGVKMKRSANRGASWDEVATPAYPAKPPDVEDIDAIRQLPIPWSLMRVWSMECGNPSESGDIWCGTIPGALFRSRDSGESWNLVEGLWFHPDRKKWVGGGADYPGIHSICVDPRDSAIIKIAVSCGGVWASFDNGQSWECYGKGMRNSYMPEDQAYDPIFQDPHRMVQCASSPDTLWIQHHNGIFRSFDGGRHWHEIDNVQPSCFGFAVAVNPRNSQEAWFVPGVRDDERYAVNGSVVVSRTRDAGKTFEVLREGLPQVHAYDLVYRHCLDVDSTGNILAFGSTTGNLWVSENQGDRWTSISMNLPPIYCVRII